MVTSRRRLEITAPGGRRLAEIDDDVVDVADAPSPGGRFRELEVELEADDAALLDSLIARLAAAGARAWVKRPFQKPMRMGLKSEAVRAVLRPSDGPPRLIWFPKTRTSAGPAGTPAKNTTP